MIGADCVWCGLLQWDTVIGCYSGCYVLLIVTGYWRQATNEPTYVLHGAVAKGELRSVAVQGSHDACTLAPRLTSPRRR